MISEKPVIERFQMHIQLTRFTQMTKNHTLNFIIVGDI